MNRSRSTPPVPVAWLGYGGLAPFIATAAGSWLDVNQRDFWQQALLGYGAVILSFVGALHWAFAMVSDSQSGKLSTRLYVWSVVPALVGWGALLCSQVLAGGGKIGSAILMAAFVLHYLQDRRISEKILLPGWYLPLRLQLTMVACLCLTTSLIH